MTHPLDALHPDLRPLANASPNRNARPAVPLRAIILHDTGGPTLDGAVSWCMDPASQVSYHYIVDLDGSVHQLVAESDRAWHAGRAAYPGEDPSDVNGTSIGVAMVNDGAKPYPDAQVRATAGLCAAILIRNWGFSLAPERVFRHADVAIPKGRKNDPHALFPMRQFAEIVAGLEPKPQRRTIRWNDRNPAVVHLRRELDRLNYLNPSDEFDETLDYAVRHFQHENGLTVDGIVGPKTWAALETARRFEP